MHDCDFDLCDKVFTSRQGKYHHVKKVHSAFMAPDCDVDVILKRIEYLEMQTAAMSKELKYLRDKHATIINNTFNNNTTFQASGSSVSNLNNTGNGDAQQTNNNNTANQPAPAAAAANNNTFKVYAIDAANTDVVSRAAWKKLVHTPSTVDAMKELMEKLFFDPKHPENMAVFVPDDSCPADARVMDIAGHWRTHTLTEAASQLVEGAVEHLVNEVDENKRKYSLAHCNRIDKFRDWVVNKIGGEPRDHTDLQELGAHAEKLIQRYSPRVRRALHANGARLT
jgi:hypothetical protein